MSLGKERGSGPTEPPEKNQEGIISRLVESYQKNRVPELHGTPEGSITFQNLLDTEGLRTALKHLRQVQQSLGNPRIPVFIKTTATLTAATVRALSPPESFVSDQAGIVLATFWNPVMPDKGYVGEGPLGISGYGLASKEEENGENNDGNVVVFDADPGGDG